MSSKSRKPSKAADYDASSVRILSSMEAVRKKRSMYLPGDDDEACITVFREVFDNAMDEVSAGYCKKVDVTLHKDGSISVADAGRGIPVGKPAPTKDAKGKKVEGVDVLISVYTVMHSGTKFEAGSSTYGNSTGTFGVGNVAVAAVCEKLHVTSERDGYVHTLGFNDCTIVDWDKDMKTAKPANDVKRGRKTTRTGTTVRMAIDYNYFEKATPLGSEQLLPLIEMMSYLAPKATVTFTDENTGKTHKFTRNSISDLATSACKDGEARHRPIEIKAQVPYTRRGDREKDGRTCEVSGFLAFGSSDQPIIHSYTNNTWNTMNGTHVDGFLAGVAKGLKGVRALKDVTPDDLTDAGLILVLRTAMPDPGFDGQNKILQKDTDARKVCAQVGERLAVSSLAKSSATGLKEVRASIAQVITARKKFAENKAVAKAERAATRSRSMPEKLKDSAVHGPGTEIFLVEGESPSGNIQRVKSDEQALYCLRGVPINPRKNSAAKVRANNEFSDIVQILGGGGTGDNFDIEKCRYERIILACDADDAGYRIAAILIGWFWDYYRPIIEEGRLYVAVTPIALAVKRKRQVALFDYQALGEFREANPGLKVSFKKGLGALSEPETRHFITDHETRRLTQVTVTDAVEAERTIELWQGQDASARRDHIFENTSGYDLAEIL